MPRATRVNGYSAGMTTPPNEPVETPQDPDEERGGSPDESTNSNAHDGLEPSLDADEGDPSQDDYPAEAD